MANADTAEFVELYSTHFQRIAVQLYAYLGDQAEAQDAAQEAFCRAYDRWETVGGYEDALAWIRRVAWNVATSKLRHLQIIARHAVRQRIEHVDGPEPDRVAMVSALAKLPDKQRLAVVLHYFGHLSVAEIAEQERVPEGTVKSWLARGRARLADYFTDKHAPELAEADLKAPGPESVAATVRRRRVARRSTLAAVLALVFAIPLTLLLLTRGGAAPIIGPTPSVTPSPSVSPSRSPGTITTRKVSIAGVELTTVKSSLIFADSQTAWLHHDSCGGIDPAQRMPLCHQRLWRSVDGAVSWREVKLPPVAYDSSLLPLPNGPAKLSIVVHAANGGDIRGYLQTVDGGQSFTSAPPAGPYAEAQLAWRGQYQMLCPGMNGIESSYTADQCRQRQLVKVGTGPLSSPLTGLNSQATVSPDGRIWVTEGEQIMVSPDEGVTWQELPKPTQPKTSGYDDLPTFSPDGTEVWLDRQGRLYQLEGGTWQERSAYLTNLKDPNFWPIEFGWAPLGNGELAMLDDRKLVFNKAGKLTPFTGTAAEYLRVLPDGSLLIGELNGKAAVGVGKGTERVWTVFEL